MGEKAKEFLLTLHLNSSCTNLNAISKEIFSREATTGEEVSERETGEPFTVVDDLVRVKQIRCFLCREVQPGNTHNFNCITTSTHPISAERVGEMLKAAGITYYLYPSEGEETMIRLGYCPQHYKLMRLLLALIVDAGGFISSPLILEALEGG